MAVRIFLATSSVLMSAMRRRAARLLDDVNRELDRLEGDLKKLIPGQPERVSSYLVAARQPAHRRRGDRAGLRPRPKVRDGSGTPRGREPMGGYLPTPGVNRNTRTSTFINTTASA
jgi:hypothetical protein